MIVLDSYAWIEHFAGTEKGKITRRYLTDGGITPSIVLAEIARKYFREGFGSKDVVKRLNFVLAKSEIYEIDIDLAVAASEAYVQLSKKAEKEGLDSPSLADGIVLATARATRSKLITGDRHFKNLDEAIYIGE